MLKKRLSIILLILAGFVTAKSQEVQKKAELNGYLTTMQSAMFDSLSGAFVNENLLHNRLNFKGYLNDHLTFAAELRNRLFTGNMGISAMWLPDIKGWFAGPSVDYSLADNLGFSLIWQHFYSIMSGERTRINLVFLRIKYSF